MSAKLAFWSLAVLSLTPSCGGGGGSGGGGGGGGGGGDTALLVADMLGSTELTVIDPDARASAVVEVREDGRLRFAVAGEAAWAGEVTGLHIHRGDPSINGPIVVDLLGGGASFAAAPHTAEGTLTIDSALAAELLATAADFYVNVHTNAAPNGLARGQLAEVEAIEWHAVLSGAEETPPTSSTGRGAAALRVGSDLQLRWVVAMSTPPVTAILNAHIHVGDRGVPGDIVVDLDAPGATVDATLGTMTNTIDVGLGDVARIALDLDGHYVNVHTAAAPNGAARGQLATGPVEMWAELHGDEETIVEDPSARGAAALHFDTFTSGYMMIAVPAATQSLNSIIAARVHASAAGADGPMVIDLFTGSDLGGSEATGSAEGSITLDQTTYARLLADPARFYANLYTDAAPAGIVRGQFTTAPLTYFAQLSGNNEVPPTDPGQQANALVIMSGVHQAEFSVSLTTPAPSEVIGLHIHDGAAGVNGPILIDLMGGESTSTSNSISGTTPYTGRTFVRLLANAAAFYVNVHTPTWPDGAARGQLGLLSADSPPAGLTYTTPVTYTTGSPISPNIPSSIGGAVTSYSVSPTLPAGLSMNTTTGVISGTPTVVAATQGYTVTATNSAGSTQAVVSITVVSGPPTSLSYTTPVTYVVGTAITANVPTFTGGAPTNYTVSPALPSGLNISPSTGVISGTPTAAQAAANYVVTGSNSAGSAQATVNITVASSLQPPSGLSYTTPVSYPTGYAITPNNPTIGGGPVSTWSISPGLPAGLVFSTTNGSITGTPTTVTAAANYTVTASNAAGSTQATVNVTVTLGAPTGLSYNNNPNIGYVTGGTFASMTPSSSGGAISSYSITPGLPNGISLNTSTGVISGSPTSTSPQTTYTVTGSNATNSTQTTIQITVLP